MGSDTPTLMQDNTEEWAWLIRGQHENKEGLLRAAKNVVKFFIANGSGDLECIRELEEAIQKVES